MSSATETSRVLAACLARCGTDQAALLAGIDDVVGLRPDDLVLAVGSLVEGLGNDKSDLDLILVPGEGDTDRAEDELCWAVGHSMVDLRILHRTGVDSLTGRLRDWARLPWNLVELAPFDDSERLLLHRLLEGLVVHPADPGPTPWPWRPDRASVARLKLQVARHLARTVQVDLVGYRGQGDDSTCVLAAQDLLGHAVDGLLAAHHLTNPNPKWRSRLLARLPDDWDRPLWTRSTGLPADRVFWNLHRAPARPEPRSAADHATRCVAFARAVFAWAEHHLIGSPALARVPLVPVRDDDRVTGAVLPALEFDVDFFFSDQGIAVARLNEFAASLHLSEQEFAHLLLCDGRTTVAAAQAAVGQGDGEAAPGVESLVQRITDRGLVLLTPARPAEPDTSPSEDAAIGAVERLNEVLTGIGYGEFLTCFAPSVLDPRAWRAARDYAPPGLRAVVDLLLLGRGVHPDALPPDLAESVAGLTAAGVLVERRDGCVDTDGLAVLLVAGSWLICHRPQPDPLCYLGDDSLALLSRLTPQGTRACLDLCAGPGLHALHCARFAPEVTAVELDPRVAQVTRLNAALNGLTDRVEVLSGDLYQPVAGRRFDLVVANPPTLPYPVADLPAPHVGHGGEDGLLLTSRVLAGLPDALTDRGRAQLVGMTLTDGGPGRFGDWLSATAREHDLDIRCTVVSHSPLTTGTESCERLIAAVAAATHTELDRVRESYARLAEGQHASHVSAYFLQVSTGSGEVALADVSPAGRGGTWFV
ncbi:methyltransferase [Lentzea sp.]|uniref:methyltransferase n=1 Tax=Lentzea sp. TaxID=56099 RepID=UPI002BA25426|nr:methyltransferase [Lentzea sp.]HUQ54817.1 methyltransferase [Lentzea sp.]